MREHVTPRAGPLIEKARGVVLDIGPGSGEWLEFFDKSKVTKIYGVEPNRDHHPALKKRIEEAELEGIYEIVPVGVEDLGEKWIGKGEVDAIVTIQCLCSVPQPKRMIGELYSYLKKGGIWVVYEHVVAFKHQGKLIKGYQGEFSSYLDTHIGADVSVAAMDIFWPHFLGGCSLTRDTERWLKEVGTWTKIDLHQPEDEPSYHVLPHTMGVLTK